FDALECLLVQNGRDEPCFERARWRVDAAVEQSVEERRVSPGLAGFGGGEVIDRAVAKEYREEVSCLRNSMWHTGFRERTMKHLDEPVGVAIECRVDVVVSRAQCRQAGGH